MNQKRKATSTTPAGDELLDHLRGQADDLRHAADKSGLASEIEAADVAHDWLEALENLVRAAHSALPLLTNAPATAAALRDALAAFRM